MLCPSCGVNVNDEDLFCAACGKSLASNQETQLYSFGPLLVNICFSRPGTFVLMQKNNTRIVLTNQRIYGLSTLTNSTRFEIFYFNILAKENFNYRLNFGPWSVLWINYREAEKTKEVSIMCSGSNSAHISEALRIINSYSPNPLSR